MNKLNAKYEMIPVNDLKIDKYQRTLEMVRAKKFAGEFDIKKVGVIIVSEREGNYYVIDGQHRTFTAKLAGVQTLMCQVLQGLTYEEEAKLFKEINTTGKKIGKADIFKADVEANDKDALEIVAITKNLGLRICKTSGDNSISAVGTITSLYKKHGREHFKETLTLIKNTWNGGTYSLNNKMLSGISEFIKVYKNEPNFSKDIFVRQLQKVDPVVIIREANNDYSSTNQDMKITNVVFKYYNARLRNRLVNRHYN